MGKSLLNYAAAFFIFSAALIPALLAQDEASQAQITSKLELLAGKLSRFKAVQQELLEQQEALAGELENLGIWIRR